MPDMIARVLAASAMMMAVPLFGQNAAPAEPIVLWGEFTTATPKAQAKVFMKSLPERRMELIPGCPAPFGYRSGKGGLVTITFMGSQAPAGCFDRLRTQFAAQLGEPDLSAVPFGSEFGYGGGGVIDAASEGLMLTWREGEKKTKLIRTPYGGFNLIITVREDKYLY
jgi:hypothetical protein